MLEQRIGDGESSKAPKQSPHSRPSLNLASRRPHVFKRQLARYPKKSVHVPNQARDKRKSTREAGPK